MSVLQIFSTCFGIVFPGLHEAAGFDVAWLALCFRGLIGFQKVQSQKKWEDDIETFQKEWTFLKH